MEQEKNELSESKSEASCSDPLDAVAFDELRAKLDVSRCSDYFDEVVAFARKAGRWTGPLGLRENLVRLVRLARAGSKAVLYKDFAPYSFEFSAGGFQGGLIFHGSHDGGGSGAAPSFAVCLEPVDGWALHS